jgi:NADH-quinone oxidoreductase subunit L
VVTVPLILLAIPSVIIGFMTIEPMLFGEFFKGVITIDAERHPAMEELAKVFEHHGGAVGMAMHAISTAPFWLALAGVVTAYVFYMLKPSIPAVIKAKTPLLNNLLENKYYFDKFNEVVIAGGARKIGEFLWKVSDTKLIDGLVVNGAAKVVNVFAQAMSLFQSGLIYQYAFAMVIGLAFFLLMIVTL